VAQALLPVPSVLEKETRTGRSAGATNQLEILARACLIDVG
jgi:hypothetical protein